ncbi:hypothetical protein FRX31_030411, partial [Thalictrum thalictroides]
MVHEAIRRSDRLKELSLEGGHASNDLFLPIEDVTICMCVLTAQMMEHIGSSCSRITSFEIGCNQDRKHQMLRPGVAGLIVNHLPRIQNLVFRGIKLCHKDFLVIVTGCLSLDNIKAWRDINLNLGDKDALRILQ